MRFLRLLFYSIVSLVLVAGWAFFYWQASTIDFASINAARSAVDALRSVDARWNDQLVGSRLPQAAAGSASRDTPRHGTTFATLEHQALKLASSPASALERNALGMVPAALAEALGLQATPSAGPSLGAALANVRSAFGEKAALMERITRVRSELATVNPADEEKHAEVSLAAEALFDQAWLAPAGPRLEAFARSLERAADDATGQAELYRTWLLYYSAFLLTVLAYLLWSLASGRARMERVNRELREANETLEQRVDERTRELSAAIVRLRESEQKLSRKASTPG